MRETLKIASGMILIIVSFVAVVYMISVLSVREFKMQLAKEYAIACDSIYAKYPNDIKKQDSCFAEFNKSMEKLYERNGLRIDK